MRGTWMLRAVVVAAAISATTMTSAGATATPAWTVGTPPLSGADIATAINAQGQVMGSTIMGSTIEHGTFFWDRGSATEIGSLGGDTYGAAVNNRGEIVGWSFTGPGRAGHAVRWQDGVLSDLGTLGGSDSSAAAVNDQGWIVGDSLGTDGNSHGFLWHDGRMQDLGAGLEPQDIDEQGNIVGRSMAAGGNTCSVVSRESVFLWHDGVTTDIGRGLADRNLCNWQHVRINARGDVLAVGQKPGEFGSLRTFVRENGEWTELTLGGTMTSGKALTDSGMVVGVAETTNGELRAFVWAHGTISALGTLGGDYSSAYAVNEQGLVVGDSRTAAGAIHAFAWEDGVMTDLGTAGGENSLARGVNDAGQVVGASQPAGRTGAEGPLVATLWQRSDGTVPEPPAPGPEELAPDPGFEAPIEGSWRLVVDRGDPLRAGFGPSGDARDAHSGNHACSLGGDPEDPNVAVRAVSTRIPVAAGHRYHFSAYLRAFVLLGEGRIDVTFWDADGNYIPDSSRSSADFGQIVSDTTGWTQLALDERAPDDAVTARLEIRVYGGAGGGVYVDDVSFTDVS